jgi:hypothetical protein
LANITVKQDIDYYFLMNQQIFSWYVHRII